MNDDRRFIALLQMQFIIASYVTDGWVSWAWFVFAVLLLFRPIQKVYL